MAKARIPIPNAKDAPGVLKLVAAVSAGITQAGAKAQITGELADELHVAAALVPEALKAHEDAKKLEKELEKLYEKRDNAVNIGLPLVQRGAKTLQGNLGPARVHEMGDYGYTVDDSPRPPRAPKQAKG